MIGSLALVLACGIVFVLWYRAHSKARNAEKLQRAMHQADEQREAALIAQKAALDSAKQEMRWPNTWEMQEGLENVPQEGLIDVPPESPEYWDVHDKLRAPPRAVRQSPLATSFDGASDKAGCQEHARPCPTTGAMSDTKGMHDAWITRLQRIQNTDLYTYNFYQEERMAKTMRKPQDGGQGFESFDELAGTGKVKILEGWHGTGGFPAANIYNDRQDGAFRPRMQTGLWYD